MLKHTLEADSILYRIGDRNLLTDVYLKCETGEVVGLLGRNGCGKTTLLQIIFGTRSTPDKSIRIDKKVYQEPYKHQNLLAYLPQHNFLPRDISLHKIISLYIKDPLRREEVKQHERIQKHLNKRADELSKGESRFFELLLLLQLDVKFLLLDEPFSGVEPLYVEHIEDLMLSNLDTKGFIITDHDYRSVLRVSDRILLLANGSCKQVKHQDELIDRGYIPEGLINT